MPLAPGTKLGTFEVISAIGAGGMGEVYRARDPQLKRDVAIKVLPATFSSDPDRLIRFKQEATATASLNHPNILSIYQIGSQDHSPYIVTELLRGDTLRGVLRNGPIPLHKAVEYATCIANGLAAAHECGIVHRDLKPENIFITKEGHLKILDFGLAKLIQPQFESEAASTAEINTTVGRVLGTFNYMAPEQLRAQPVDARADVFSFGAILYELLSGRRAFDGATVADTQSAILKEEPAPLSAGNPQIPRSLEMVVNHCLEKSPDRRFQSARDLAFHLESLGSARDSGSIPSVPQISSVLPQVMFSPLRTWMAAAVLLLAAIGFTWWLRGRQLPQSSRSFVQFQRLTSLYGLEETPAISPDGKSVAFVSDSGGSRQILVRLLSGGTPLQLTAGEQDHLGPRWSQDSTSIFYYTPPSEVSRQATAWEISALGGQPRRLLDSLGEVDPSHDGKSLAFFRLANNQIELVRTDRDGSNPRVLAQFPSKTGCRQPRWSPDDSSVAFIQSADRWTDLLYFVPSSGGAPLRVTSEPSLVSGYSWLPTGAGFVYSTSRNATLLYLPIEHLWRISSDGRRLRQLTFGDDDDESPDVDSTGRLVASRRRINTDIWKFPVGSDPKDNVSRAIRVTRQTSQIQTPTLSPDDQQLAYLSDTGGHGNIWVMDLGTQQVRQLTYDKDENFSVGVPLWAPDGSFIAYARNNDYATQYWLVRPDGRDNHLFIPSGSWFTWAWDSRWAYYIDNSRIEDLSSIRLVKSALAGGPAIEIRRGVVTGPAISGDGSSLYFAKTLEPINGLWDYEIHVARPETADSKVLTRISGQRVPVWQGLHPVISRDGDWLAMPLNDRFGTNLWLLSTKTGQMRQLTDFGDRRTFIARRVSWTSDDKFIFAAVGEGDADIVLMNGLLD